MCRFIRVPPTRPGPDAEWGNSCHLGRSLRTGAARAQRAASLRLSRRAPSFLPSYPPPSPHRRPHRRRRRRCPPPSPPTTYNPLYVSRSSFRFSAC
ncbi:hypothetical protein FA95DRAFT_1559814 [Auriscalpium vulgare]|uniref:Uncharacterized protein n=1 Tax=Auriscalpium vulgare TaxID=40419 RepID=A0ACB8RRH0_9AGAM|nr:hypothetical protein FA95DRAFT_1559814 [Auriscalpium vulgare]